MSQEEQRKLQKVWAVEIEVLERKLRLWSEHGAQGSPRFRQAVERKQLLVSEMENSKELQELELAKLRELAAAHTEVQRVPASKRIEQGKFCDQVIDEIKRIKNLCRGSGQSIAEIEQEHPGWAVWKVRELLGPDDKDTFNHPNQWGPTVGYAKTVLSKAQGAAVDTISSWVKAYRAYRKSRETKQA